MGMMKTNGVLTFGATLTLAVTGGLSSAWAAGDSKFAEVVVVKEARATVTAPKEVCEQVQVQKQAPVKDERRVAGTVLGGLAGGVLGHQVGGGTGKTVATVAGAAAGAYAGNQVQKNMQQKDVETTTEKRCKTIDQTSEKLLGYDVTYRLDGKEGKVRLSFHPGKRIPVQDGYLVLTPPESGK